MRDGTVGGEERGRGEEERRENEGERKKAGRKSKEMKIKGG